MTATKMVKGLKHLLLRGEAERNGVAKPGEGEAQRDFIYIPKGRGRDV